MTFWIAAGLISLAALALMIAPLLRQRRVEGRAAHDAAAWRAQLAEIDRDIARGLLTEAEAEGARIETSRKLLAAAEKAAREDAPRPAPRAASYALAAALLAGAPLAAAALYLQIGNPGLPDAPLKARTADSERLSQEQAERLAEEAGAVPTVEAPVPVPGLPDFETLLARLEERLEEVPGDPRGLDLLSRTYYRMGRYADAWRAYQRLIDASETPGAAAYAGMGEAMVFATGGYVSPQAEAAFARALALDPGDFRARHYRALTHAQQGRTLDALEGWRALLGEASGAEPWYAMVRDRAVQAADRLGIAPETILPPPPRGPSAADVEAAGAMSEEDRAAMIEGMVAGLAERLSENPDDPQGWQRLIQAYRVLGREDDAAAALARAREAFAGNPAVLEALQ